MTISTTVSRVEYAGNGVTTVFPIPFRFLENAHIVALLVPAAGVPTSWALSTNYTLAGADADGGGTLTALVAPAVGTRLVIYRDIPATQETDYISGDPFPAESHERALDKLTMLAQQDEESLDRAIKLPVSDVGVSTTLPAASQRLDRLLSFDAATGAPEMSDFTHTQVASAVAAAYSGAAGPLDALSFIQAGAGAVSRTAQDKARETVSVWDFMSEVQRADALTGSATIDVTSSVMAAIDSLPDTGGRVELPVYTIRAHGILLQGTVGTKSNVELVGKGFASRIRAPDASSLNVIEATAGSNHRVRDCRVSGSKDTGGTAVRGPSRGMWVTGATYAVNDRVEVTSGDAATTTVAASNIVYRCTTAHTAGATFAGDKASKWVLVSEPNFNTSDLSYRYRNGIYFDGVANCVADGVLIDNCVYAGFKPGTGPVQPANAGPGTDRNALINSFITLCENGIAGGSFRDVDLSNTRIFNCDQYGAVVDISSGDCNLFGLNIQSCGNSAILVYGQTVQRVVIDGYTISACLNGIVIDGARIVELGTGTIDNVTNVPLFVRGAELITVKGGTITTCAKGAQFETSSKLDIDGLTVNDCEDSGVKFTACSAINLSSTKAFGNALHGIEYQTCDNVTQVGNRCQDNNTSLAANGAGIFGNNTTNVQGTGNQCSDSRGGGSKTQEYGVRTEGTCTGWNLIANRFAGNKTANQSMVGTNVYEYNDLVAAPTRIGGTVGTITGSVTFTAGDTKIAIRDENGVVRWGLFKNSEPA